MKPGRIELVHTFQGETNYVILRWYKTSAPLTSATGYVTGTGLGAQNATTRTNVVYPAPHIQESLLIEDLDPVMYLVKAFRSSDGVAMDSEIFTLACDAGANATYSTITYTYVVDRGEGDATPGSVWNDPVDGDTQLRDERLNLQTYDVWQRMIGRLLPPSVSNNEWIDRSDAGGGFDFNIPGKVFESGQVYWATVAITIAAPSSSSSVIGGFIDGVVPLTIDGDFDPDTMFNKLLYANFAGSGGAQLTFINVSVIPDGFFKVSTHGGNQKYLQLQFDSGDTIRYMSEDKNVIYLGKSEEISIFVKDNVFYVLDDTTGYRRLGQRIWGDKLELNTLYRDGTQYNQSDYPRLMEFVDSLPVGNVVSEAVWASSITDANGQTIYPNKGLFARDDGAGKIRVPDDRNMFMRSLKYLDATVDAERQINKPGGHQSHAFFKHNHTVASTNSNNSSSDTADVVRGTSPGTVNTKGGLGSGKTIGETGNAIETRSENIGLIPLLCV